MKKLLLILYVVCLIVMGAATLIENSYGTDFVTDHLYHSYWFIALWAALSCGLVAALVHYKLWRRWAVCSLHASFLVILLGALVTFVTSQKGVVHLQPGVAVSSFQTDDLKQTLPLPFTLQLDSFHIVCYPGTEAPADYASYVRITTAKGEKLPSRCISMNRILKQQGYRFYQSSFDEDRRGSWLSVNYDPWGTAITYAGYLLLLLSMLGVLFSRHEEFVRLLRHPLLRKGAFVMVLLFAAAPSLQARELPAFNRAKADSLAARQIIYNDRVAPFNTLARDFLQKIYGRSSYHGLTAEQVVTGWLFSPEVWQNEPMFLIKSAQLRQLLHLEGKYARLTDLFQGEDYVLQRYWKGGNAQAAEPNDPLQKAIAETDEKVGLIMMLQKGTLIQPLPTDGSVKPLSPLRIKAELLYNRLPLAKVLFMCCLTLGLLAFVRMVWSSVRQTKEHRLERILFPTALYLCTLTLAFAFGLRWYVAQHVPMSNGFETMQFMALVTLIVASLLHRRFKVLLPFGFILAGFALLVSFLGQSNPQITNLMPVLASPWLSLHVSIVMMGYSLLAFVMLTGIMGLCMKQQAEALMLLGRLLLYPAVFFLGIGIFLGAVWANQSWGTYWSWDPKETWALITFMTYAAGFHAQSLPWFRKPSHFHLFSILAFLTVLMTYFGVNFVLGGMHSYAG